MDCLAPLLTSTSSTAYSRLLSAAGKQGVQAVLCAPRLQVLIIPVLHQLAKHNQHVVPVKMSFANVQGWPEPYVYGVNTVFLAGKSSNIRSYTVYIYGSGQFYKCRTSTNKRSPFNLLQIAFRSALVPALGVYRVRPLCERAKVIKPRCLAVFSANFQKFRSLSVLLILATQRGMR